MPRDLFAGRNPRDLLAKSNQMGQVSDEITKVFGPQKNFADIAYQEQPGQKQDNPLAYAASHIGGDILTGLGKSLGRGGEALAKVLTLGHAPSVDWDTIFQPQNPQDIDKVLQRGTEAAGDYYMARNIGLPIAKGAAKLPIKGVKETYNLGAKGTEWLAGKLAEKYAKTPLSSQELETNLRASEGTETNLGDIIENPEIKAVYENIMKHVPFGGAPQAMQRAGESTQQKGQDFLSELLGKGSYENIPKDVGGALRNQESLKNAYKNELYEIPKAHADEIGLNFKIPNTVSKIKEHKNSLLENEYIKSEPEVQSLIKRLANYENVKQGKIPKTVEEGEFDFLNAEPGEARIPEQEQFEPLRLEDVGALKSKLNELQADLRSSPKPLDRKHGRLIGEIARTLRKDIDKELAATGDPELLESWKKAERNYAKDYKRFLEPEIWSHIQERADPDTLISQFLKTSRSADLETKLGKLVDLLPAAEKNLVAYEYFSEAIEDGAVNVNALNTRIRKLGDRQFKKLIPDPQVRQQIKDFSRLTKMNQEGIRIMENTKTGQRNNAVSVLGTILGVGSGIGTLGAASAITRGATKTLTSDKVRKKVVDRLIQEKRTQEALKKAQEQKAALIGK